MAVGPYGAEAVVVVLNEDFRSMAGAARLMGGLQGRTDRMFMRREGPDDPVAVFDLPLAVVEHNVKPNATQLHLRNRLNEAGR